MTEEKKQSFKINNISRSQENKNHRCGVRRRARAPLMTLHEWKISLISSVEKVCCFSFDKFKLGKREMDRDEQ